MELLLLLGVAVCAAVAIWAAARSENRADLPEEEPTLDVQNHLGDEDP